MAPTTAEIQRYIADRRRAQQQASAAVTGRTRAAGRRMAVAEHQVDREQFERSHGVAAMRRRMVQLAEAERRRDGQEARPAVLGAERRTFPASVRLTR
jgi:hypothetical protein